MSNAHSATKVRQSFVLQQKPLTLADIKVIHPDLQASEISMALSYLMKQGYLTRVQIPNNNPKGRKVVFKYTYHKERIKL